MANEKAPLEAWVAEKIGAAGAAFSREALDRYQLAKLRTTIDWAIRKSPFYRKLLAGFSGRDLVCLTDLGRLPFTTADDLRRQGLQFICVTQDEISRVVTLDSSGTTGPAKRLYFTPADQQATIDFFRQGMAALAGADDRVLILLPGQRPGSVGDLLATALGRLGAEAIAHGPVRSLPATLAIMDCEAVSVVVGAPTQVLALARWADAMGKPLRLKSVLLSTDHVPQAISRELSRLWGCGVFEHYGMTELGLGGGTECAAHAGYHLHEADFYFEIVDPQTGQPLPAGQAGEVVATTLTRWGMPLIRYRTGDLSRLVDEPCACGSVLRRLERITGRVDGRVTLAGGLSFTLADLDESLFAVDKVIDFTARVDSSRLATKLVIDALMASSPVAGSERSLLAALDAVPALRQARRAGTLTVTVAAAGSGDALVAGPAKRAIRELNAADG